MKNIDIKQLTTAVRDILPKLQRYATLIFVVAIFMMYAFLIFRISVLSQATPSEDAVAEQTNTIKRLKLDQNSIDKIKQLEDQNVGVQSLFESARDNPFQD